MTKPLAGLDQDRAFPEIIAGLLARVTALETLVSTLGPGVRRTFSPQVKFGGSTTNVSGSGSYWFDGDWIEWEISWSTTGAPTAGGFTFVLPVAGINSGVGATFPDPAIGTAVLLDVLIQRYRAIVSLGDSTTVCRLDMGTSAGQNIVSNANPFSWGNGDNGYASGRYRWR